MLLQVGNGIKIYFDQKNKRNNEKEFMDLLAGIAGIKFLHF